MDNNQHFSTRQLVDFLEGRMEDTTKIRLLMHLKSGCQTCSESLAFYKRMFSAIQTLHWQAPSPTVHQKIVQAFWDQYPVQQKNRPAFTFRPAIIGYVILVLFALIFLFNLNPTNVVTGYIETVVGNVEMLVNPGGAWKTVTPGEPVPIHAAIRTLDDSHITLTFPGGETAIVGSNSEIELVSLFKAQGEWNIELDQKRGKIEHQTAQSTGSYSVHTSAGTFSSTGAHFLMDINPDGSVSTNVVEGSVQSTSNSQSMTIRTGQTTLSISETYSPPISPSDFEQYNDMSLNPTPYYEITFIPSISGSQNSTPTPEVILNPEATPSDGNSINSGNSNNSGNSSNSGNSENPGNSGNSENNGNNNNANTDNPGHNKDEDKDKDKDK